MLNVMQRNPKALIAVVVPVAVVVLLVIAALLARRDPVVYQDGTPEATVQAYFQAVVDRDPRRAYELFTPELQERCQPPGAAEISYLTVARAVLDDVVIDEDGGEDGGGSATVWVSVTEAFEGGPFGSNESTTVQTVYLERVDNEWGIAEVPWPFFCVRRS